MPCGSDGEESNAPPDPSFSTPTKVIRNAGAAHAESDAEGMETEADVEKQFDKSTGKKRKFAPFHEYSVVGQWATGPDSLLEPAEIEHQIKMLMEKFMQDSRLMIAPGKDPEKNKTDKALWKQQRKEYWNSRTDEMVHTFKCPMDHRCRCKAKVRIITGKGYKRLEFHGTHDVTSHAADHWSNKAFAHFGHGRETENINIGQMMPSALVGDITGGGRRGRGARGSGCACRRGGRLGPRSATSASCSASASLTAGAASACAASRAQRRSRAARG